MPSQLDVDKIRHTNGTDALTFDTSGNTNLQKDLKFSSTAAIKNSAGNNILSESGGTITLTTNSAVIEGSSSGNLVRITQTGTGNALVVEDSANPDSTPFVVNPVGNVGIGTSSPSNTVHAYHPTRNVICLIESGDNGAYLGFKDDTTTSSSAMYLGVTGNDMQFVTSAVERMRIDSSGAVLVGTTNIDAGIGDTSGTDTQASYRPSQGYRQKNGTNFYNRTSTGDFYRFRYQGAQVGSVSIGTTATAYNTSSDYRLKENITNITDGINRIKQLNPSRFNFISDPDKIVDGFIAHEVQDIVPEAISGEKDAVNEDGSIDPQGIDQSKLIPLLTAALQEAIALIESKQSQIDALTTRIEALETN